MELGKQIKKHRQEVQLSQEELAERVWEHPKVCVNLQTDVR